MRKTKHLVKVVVLHAASVQSVTINVVNAVSAVNVAPIVA
jgi:hypothetical protein